MNLGERIKSLRADRGIERADLAKIIGITYHALSKYETNEREPDYEILKIIADYFRVTTDYLLGRQVYAETTLTGVAKLTVNDDTSPQVNELLETVEKLSPEQQDVILTVAKAMAGQSSPSKDEKAATMEVASSDPIADIPYWNLRLKALREEKGVTLEEAAVDMHKMTNNFITADILREYEEGRNELEPSDLAAVIRYYHATREFIMGSSNDRRSAGQVHGVLEAASRTDNPINPLPEEAERSLNAFKKEVGLFCEEKGGKEEK